MYPAFSDILTAGSEPEMFSRKYIESKIPQQSCGEDIFDSRGIKKEPARKNNTGKEDQSDE